MRLKKRQMPLFAIKGSGVRFGVGVFLEKIPRGGWWLVVGGWCLVVGGWWLVIGDWGLGIGDW